MSEYPKPGPVTGLLESTKAPNRNILVVGAVSVGLILLGAFLPWVKAQAGFISISRNGFEDGGDGLFTLLIGIGVGIVVWAGYNRRVAAQALYLIILVSGLVTAGISVYDMDDVDSRRERLSAEEREVVDVSIGEGLYLTLIGGLGLAAAGIAGFAAKKPLGAE